MIFFIRYIMIYICIYIYLYAYLYMIYLYLYLYADIYFIHFPLVYCSIVRFIILCPNVRSPMLFMS